MNEMYTKNVDEALLALTEQIDILKKRAEDNISAPMKILPYKVPEIFHQNIEKFFLDPEQNFRKASTVEQVDRCLEVFKKIYDSCLTDLNSVHQLNIPIVEHNRVIRDKVSVIMRSIGIFDTFNTYDFKTVRSHEKTPTKHNSGYLDDLNRVVKLADNYLTIKGDIDKTSALVEQYGSKLKTEILSGK